MKPLLALGYILMIAINVASAVELKTTEYGKLPNGTPVQLFTLTNTHGMVARVIEYGAILASVAVPNQSGKEVDITLGYDSLEGWLGSTAYFGATVGRFANRIAHGQFTLEGIRYTLATNNHPGNQACHLHGGNRGFDKVLWSGEAVQRPGARGVRLTYVSADGEEGYPGTLTAHVVYWLTDDNELIWDAEATTDKTTIVNLAQHTYWNLSGDPSRTIERHLLTLHADRFLPTDAGLIPRGDVAPVAGTPMDFRKPTAIGARLNQNVEALKIAGGYDHAWILKGNPRDSLHQAATLTDPDSGRAMRLYTNQPAVQFYSGNFLDGTVTGKGGIRYPARSGLCLETEGFSDAPNQGHFPSAVLHPGERYHHVMVSRFKF